MRLQTPFYTILFLSQLVLIPACKKNTTTDPAPPPPPANPVIPKYELVWSDEFENTAINAANWNFETGGGGWGNNEKQYYQSSNATVSGGNLVITAKKEQAGSNAYTSARMTTQNKQQFTFGKIEARVKVPQVLGIWPAFWALGTNINTVGWPACGEIDVMEHINTENLIYGTMHWDNNGYVSYGGKKATTPEDFHIYSIEWTPTSITWFIDNVPYHEANIQSGINGTDEFQKPFFIILNMAVGGNWPGQVIDESKLPATYLVDYVRVYQLK